VSEHVAEKPSVAESLAGLPRPAVAKPHARSKAIRFFQLLGHELYNDNITDVGAMMAYYAVLAVFPMLVFVVTLALLILPNDVVMQGVAMATRAMPYATREVVTTQVTALMRSAQAGFAIGGAAFALWGASRGASALTGALNAMFNKQETRPWWKRQLLAIAVTLGVALAVVLALGLLVVGPLVGHWATQHFGLDAWFDVAWDIARWVGAGLLVMVVWAVLYKFLPDTRAPFRVFTPGAIVGVLLWLGISYGFGFYLSRFNSYAATYGALGGAIIFLTWLWLSNIAILFGAEINDVLADLRKDSSPAAAMLAAETRRTSA
jgi:membrane protein